MRYLCILVFVVVIAGCSFGRPALTPEDPIVVKLLPNGTFSLDGNPLSNVELCRELDARLTGYPTNEIEIIYQDGLTVRHLVLFAGIMKKHGVTLRFGDKTAASDPNDNRPESGDPCEGIEDVAR